ncbi:MAG TPA: ATP-binding protein [Thermoanaerobaculia bacterium]|jgi:signal transduction histidine kinase|nr:ATP-binding protein [Thermoanaerobaculia bacterium]
MKSIGVVVIALGVTVALLATGVAVVFAVQEAKAEAREAVAAAVPARNVASIKTYDAAGKLLRESVALPQRPPFYGLAAKLAPAEVTCSGVEGGTVCVETTPAPLARRLRSLLIAGAAGMAGAIVLGLLAATVLNRRLAAPLRSMADVLDKASGERAWSLRVEPASGDLGRMAASINELLSQIQSRDIDIRRRTLELESANKELEAFAYSVSHDLRAPLGSIDGFTQALELDYGHLFDETAKEYVSWVRQGCHQMRELIDGMLQMSRLARADMERVPVDLSQIARSVADSLQQSHPDRQVKFEIRNGVRTFGDERLLRAVLENLISNAWKFTRNRSEAHIEFGANDGTYYVRDNGAGFDPSHAAKMFRPFQRLHSSREFEGTGIGLATVQKIIERHGGRAWAEGEVGKGATIYFTTAERV